jgi:shikimate dehydrogenase
MARRGRTRALIAHRREEGKPMDTRAEERHRIDSPVDAHTRLFFIIGDPISHVRAPVVWSALMKRHGINAVLLPAHVESVGLDDAIRGAKALKNLAGLMFTMPHKVAAIRHADTLSARAQRVGSINLLRRDPDGRWAGDNVDGAGFIAGLRADGVVLDGLDVYVHGCGGVGQNIAWSLAMEPIASLTVFDIDAEGAAQFAARLSTKSRARIRACAATMRACGLAVNASPLGLEPTDPLPFAVGELPRSAVVADVIMEPLMTPLLSSAQDRGLKIHHGRHMMNFAMPLAAAFYGLPAGFDWNGAPMQN